jgi:hypothetical protein
MLSSQLLIQLPKKEAWLGLRTRNSALGIAQAGAVGEKRFVSFFSQASYVLD